MATCTTAVVYIRVYTSRVLVLLLDSGDTDGGKLTKMSGDMFLREKLAASGLEGRRQTNHWFGRLMTLTQDILPANTLTSPPRDVLRPDILGVLQRLLYGHTTTVLHGLNSPPRPPVMSKPIKFVAPTLLAEHRFSEIPLRIMGGAPCLSSSFTQHVARE